MFSEYASRFLAQSQSRISFASPQDQLQRVSRHDPGITASQRRPHTRLRPTGVVGFGQLGFASKAHFQAPLLHGRAGNGEIGSEGDNDEEEHEREVADYFALQRSRKHFVHGHLESSSEVEIENDQDLPTSPGRSSRRRHVQDGIKSSWLGERSLQSSHGSDRHDFRPLSSPVANTDGFVDTLSSVNLSMTGNGLDSASNSAWPNQVSASNAMKLTMNEPEPSPDIRGDKDDCSVQDSGIASELPDKIQPLGTQIVYHDRFWGQIYLIVMIAFLTSFVLVWLRVSLPFKHPLGDTVYNTIRKSYHILAIDTTVAVIVSLLWLALLRHYARPLVYAILLGVPTVLIIFSLYSFISSLTIAGNSRTYQHKIMRWLSPAPLIFGGLWLYGIYNSRHSFRRAIELLELAVKILASYSPLIFIGFGALAAIVIWTWLWIAVFTRVFLGGHFTSNLLFVVDFGTWCLGIFYVLIYLWTLSIISGVQRATTAASVSQWYFHRLNVPTVTAEAVVRAALSHALTTCFGTVCLSTSLALLVRLPILILPKRAVILAGFFSATLIPDSISILTLPTTLTHAAIHSQSLVEAARVVAQFSFVARKGRHGRRVTGLSPGSANRPHQLALLLMYATRLASSFGFGFGAWVYAARAAPTETPQLPYKGSIYAYIVGLIAGVIGWTVIGAVEGILTSIVDAVVICWESEVSTGSEAHYCREADMILGDVDGQFHPQDEGISRLVRL